MAPATIAASAMALSTMVYISVSDTGAVGWYRGHRVGKSDLEGEKVRYGSACRLFIQGRQQMLVDAVCLNSLATHPQGAGSPGVSHSPAHLSGKHANPPTHHRPRCAGLVDLCFPPPQLHRRTGFGASSEAGQRSTSVIHAVVKCFSWWRLQFNDTAFRGYIDGYTAHTVAQVLTVAMASASIGRWVTLSGSIAPFRAMSPSSFKTSYQAGVWEAVYKSHTTRFHVYTCIARLRAL